MTTLASDSFVSPARAGLSGRVWAILALWFAAALALGAVKAFDVGPDEWPLLFLAVVASPPTLFLAAYGLSTRVRDFALGLDLRFLTAMQGWRVMGMAFLFLHGYGLLPGLFAWPGGAGDVAVGLAAPFALFAQLRKSPGWQRKVFWLNIGGLADFAVAVVSGLSVSPTALGLLAGDVTTGIVLQLPLALIPIYAVPVFMIAHAISLLQLRRLSAEG